MNSVQSISMQFQDDPDANNAQNKSISSFAQNDDQGQPDMPNSSLNSDGADGSSVSVDSLDSPGSPDSPIHVGDSAGLYDPPISLISDNSTSSNFLDKVDIADLADLRFDSDESTEELLEKAERELHKSGYLIGDEYAEVKKCFEEGKFEKAYKILQEGQIQNWKQAQDGSRRRA